MSIDADTLLTLDVVPSSYSEGAHAVAIGIAGANGQTWYRVVCPMEGWEDWDPVTELMHGIERGTAITHGRDAYLVARELNAMLMGKTVIVDNELDTHWVCKLFSEVAVDMAFKISVYGNHVSSAEAIEIDALIKSQEWPHVANADAALLRKILRPYFSG